MKLKRVMGWLLASAMIVSLAACGGGSGSSDTSGSGGTAGSSADSGSSASSVDTGDMVTVQVAMPSFYDMTDAPMVNEAINEILAERYGIQCQITFISSGSWTQQSNLLLTSDEVDVICYYTLPLTTYVSNGQCLPLDDYVASASDKFKSLFTEEQMNGCKIDGVQYAIPNLRNYGSQYVVFFDEAKLAELGYNPDEITTMDQVEEVLYAAHEAYPDIYTVVPQSASTFCNLWTWEGLGDNAMIGVLGNCGQDETVVDIFECEDFIEFCNYTHQWYTDGLIMGDALSNQESGTTMIQNGAAFASFSNRANEVPPAGLTQSVLVQNWTPSANISALTYGINALSSHPDEAWTMLEALYTDTDIMTLLIDGIQDVHYVLNDDGSASYPEGVTATTSTYGNATTYWAMPYAEGVPPITDLGSPTFFDDLIEFNNESLISKGTGFILDTDALGVTDQYTACQNVVDKYYDGLMNGVLDPDTVMAQAHQEMIDAGIEDIIAVKQAALDELLGK